MFFYYHALYDVTATSTPAQTFFGSDTPLSRTTSRSQEFTSADDMHYRVEFFAASLQEADIRVFHMSSS